MCVRRPWRAAAVDKRCNCGREGTSCLQKCLALANDYSYADRMMNDDDDHAVSVVKAETIVGHVPRGMSRTFWHFIMHGGSVGCEITGWRTLGKGGGADKRGWGALTVLYGNNYVLCVATYI